MVRKVILGSLKGNPHGLGKDIVAATLRAAGFLVVDLGLNVSPERFVDAAVREKAKVIGISISVNETVPLLKDVVKSLRQRNGTYLYPAKFATYTLSGDRRLFSAPKGSRSAWERRHGSSISMKA